MKSRHKLWLAITPVIAAAAIVFIVLIFPQRTRHYSKSELQTASISLSNNVFKGQSIKTQALKHGYVPFFGSSELARQDFTHPSLLAAKYKRSYRPFLLGKAGTQSLAHYFGMQSMTEEMYGKKAVYVLSPQWFVKRGQDKNAFSTFYSPLSTVSWLLKADNTLENRYAAQRLMKMHVVNENGVMGQAIERTANGKALTSLQRAYLKVRLNILQNEDQLFANLQVTNKNKNFVKQFKKLPDTYSYQQLDTLASEAGEVNTDTNRFGIENKVFKKIHGSKLKHLAGKQKSFDYRRSPEYGDLELILSQFQRSNTNVLFIIPPVNAKWSAYTGLSTTMLKQTSHKIKQQLRSQGFTNILDLSDQGHVKYFMQDSIHLGWRGWLAVDQKVQPFLERKQKQPHYHLNDYYFSTEWQNKIIN